MNVLRWALYALAGVAFAACLWFGVEAGRFVARSEAVTATVEGRQKVGLRTWEIALAFPGPDGAERRVKLRGYYNDPAHAPGAEVPLRVAGDDVRPAAWEDLAIPPLVAGLLGGVFLWLAALLGRGPRASGAGAEKPQE
ncbi:MAG: hypothetical protein D6708_10455 [Candidatus Dadabacteria bacterium]|nr:MAG: hypothetical protein D6708_10455 [Candidatus Dadabacteria bacterium]